MKPTLEDYILQERGEIFKQQETIEKLTSLFDELKSFFETIDIEKGSDQRLEEQTSSHCRANNEPRDFVSVSNKGDSSSRRPSQSSNVTQSPLTLSRSPKLATVPDKDEIRYLARQETCRLGDDNHAGPLRSVHAQIDSSPSRRKAKSDNYRIELLKQIEEKQRLKQLEIERQKAADEELEQKITQQRLAMYLDYLEERKRGDFIAKAKQLSVDQTEGAKLTLDGSERPEGVKWLLPSSSRQEANSNEASHMGALGRGWLTADDAQTQPPVGAGQVPGKDMNILANLSEVRKIMHHDHIQLLEQLLELHIK